ncbi:MAG: hypothetical protein JXA24_05810 [Proteobacteria bacterium]|nr:hypothetical protein [Pseudomonadota bacterium]
MNRTLRISALIVLAAFFVAGCARTPEPKTSQKVIRSYFKKYGKKYPTTVYGKSKVRDVEVTGTDEIRKHLVAVDSFLTLADGQVQRIHATLQKGPFGWKFVSWELAAQGSAPAP